MIGFFSLTKWPSRSKKHNDIYRFVGWQWLPNPPNKFTETTSSTSSWDSMTSKNHHPTNRVKWLEPNTSPLHIFKKQRAQHETHFIIFHPNVLSTKSRIRARRIVESSMVFGNICCNSRANASRGNLKSPCIAIGHWKGNSEIVEWLLGCAPKSFKEEFHLPIFQWSIYSSDNVFLGIPNL